VEEESTAAGGRKHYVLSSVPVRFFLPMAIRTYCQPFFPPSPLEEQVGDRATWGLKHIHAKKPDFFLQNLEQTYFSLGNLISSKFGKLPRPPMIELSLLKPVAVAAHDRRVLPSKVGEEGE
jgi:hypothetical protein